MNYYRGRPQGTMRSTLERGDPRKFASHGLNMLAYSTVAITLNGSDVAAWGNLDGSGNNMTATGAEQPAYNTTGQPFVEFDGVANIMNATYARNSPQHLFLVSKTLESFSAAEDMFGGNPGGVGTGNVMRGYRGASGTLRMTNPTDIAGTGFTPESWHVLSYQFNGASSFAKEDGVARISGNAGTSNATGLTLGAGWFFGSITNPTNIGVKAVVGFSTAIPTYVELRVQKHLAAFAGIAG